MVNDVTRILLLASLLFAPASFTGPFENLYYTTEDYPPFNYREQGKLTGISIEILNQVWQELGVAPQKIDVMPWARAFKELQQNSHHVLFAVSKTAKREQMFKWACPISTVQVVLVALKSRNITINHLNELKDYRIGTVRSDAGEHILRHEVALGDNISSNVSIQSNLVLLDKNRIQLFTYDSYALPNMLRQYGYDPENYQIVYPLKTTTACFAFNKAVDDKLVQTFQQALLKVISNEKYSLLYNKYFHSPR
ncbi:substrate-binding periplasmic protein [Thalassomonas actiniarum]|uniref:Amino acid ABC transporter substrate-binding protein n=1 Tax=Thalassomonas actiniarum TaxID=485447 RepID=A0AAF0C3Z2_9GAMM|nr:transporter substrate-binding domain-containing protein [Thalassomonas actiniarum]WDE00073.1 amino acid ABC transporter substrate-binding protein [Thalassomonas actiniarum]